MNDKTKTCSVAECKHRIKARGLCSKHYQQERRKGGLDFLCISKKRRRKQCVINSCLCKQRTWGLCNRHYKILYRYRKKENIKCERCQTKIVYSSNFCKKHYDGTFRDNGSDSVLEITNEEMCRLTRKYDLAKGQVKQFFEECGERYG